MRLFTKSDRDIEEAILQRVRMIDPSPDMFTEINKRIYTTNKGVPIMKSNPVKRYRGVLIACFILVLTTITCFAAVKIVSYRGGCADNTFDTYPSQEQMLKAAGFSPKYVEQFENGYEFKLANTGELEGNDASGNKVAMIKTAEFIYLKEDAEIYLNTNKNPNEIVEQKHLEGEEIEVTENQKVTYIEYLNKCKPADYVMTKQDKLDEANGTYVFSFGENADFVKHIQIIDWEDDGISYALECYDDKLDKDKLLEMAKEIISSKGI